MITDCGSNSRSCSTAGFRMGSHLKQEHVWTMLGHRANYAHCISCMSVAGDPILCFIAKNLARIVIKLFNNLNKELKYTKVIKELLNNHLMITILSNTMRFYRVLLSIILTTIIIVIIIIITSWIKVKSKVKIEL